MAVEKVNVFCNGYNELAFLCNVTDQHEIQVKNVNRCLLLNVTTTTTTTTIFTALCPGLLG